MPAGDQLKDDIAAGNAEADEIAEDDGQRHHDALQALLASPEGRDPEIWEDAFEALVAPFGAVEFEEWVTWVSDDFVNMEPSPFKAPAWQAMVAAATSQANVQTFRELLPVVDKQAAKQNKAAAKLSGVQLVAVAKEGVSKERFKRAKDERKAARDVQ